MSRITLPQSNSKATRNGLGEKDEVQKLQQDLITIQAKLNELNNIGDSNTDIVISNSVPNTPITSSFVSGIRGITGVSDNENNNDTRTSLIEKIVDKISELDRCILRKTKPEGINNEIASARRMSRGTDLYLLPTHLHVADRLLDLSVQLKREKCLTGTLKIANEQITNKSSLSTLSVLAHSLTPTSPRMANDNGARLSKQLEESQSKLSKLQEEHSAARRQILDVNNNYELLKDELKHREQLLNEQSNIEISKYKQYMLTLEESISNHEENYSKLIDLFNKSADFICDAIEAKQSYSILQFNQLVNNNKLHEFVGNDSKKSMHSVLRQSVNRFIQAISELYTDLFKKNELYQLSSVQAISQRDALNDELKRISDENNDSILAYKNLQQEYKELQHRILSVENDMEIKLLNSNDIIEQLQSELSSSRRRLLELENFVKKFISIQESFRVIETNNVHLEFKVKGISCYCYLPFLYLHKFY